MIVEQEQAKKQVTRKFWWIWIILFVGLLVLGFAAYNGYKHDQELKKLNEKNPEENQQQPPQEQIEMSNGQVIVNDYGNTRRGEPARAFTSSQLAAMEAALSKGINIEDGQNDWETTPDTLPEGEIDNTNPYPLPWTDLKSVSFGADEEYIYFKFQFWGIFPRDPVTYDGDLIRGVGTYVAQLKFGPNENDWAQLQNSISYMDEANTSKIAAMPRLHHEAMISPTGERDEKLDDIYQKNAREGMIGGGADTDYLLAAYPLKLFGLEYGNITTFNLGTESHSTKYHHVAKDHILALPNPDTVHGGTISGTIRWAIGSNTYENLSAPKKNQERPETMMGEGQILTSSKLVSAEKALVSGTKIIDKTGDWVQTENKEDNPSPYHLDFMDIREVDIGIDENYLYLKSTFNGKWPKNSSEGWPSINGDQIFDIGFSIYFDTDNNPQTGCQADGGVEICIGYGTRINMAYGNPPGTWNDYKTDSSGIDDPEEKRYLNSYYIDDRMIGGPGYDYVINAYPLKELKLKAGQEVSLKIKAEAMSNKYHHASFDDMNFLGETETPGIRIKLGENKTISLN